MSSRNDISVEIVAMTPAETTGGCASLTIDYGFAPTPFGDVLISATAKGICCLFFADRHADSLAELKTMFPRALFSEKTTPAMTDALAVFDEPTTRGHIRVPLHLKGTVFQLSVWRALVAIPWGELRSYSDIAAATGHPKACRAAGSAIGANPVSILVPCHRVVRRTGETGNYRWGSDRKTALIESERQ